MSRCYSPVLALLLASACAIVEEQPYQALPESIPDGPDERPNKVDAGMDAGDTGVDGPIDAGPDATPAAPPPRFDEVTFNDRCDEDGRKLLSLGQYRADLDTTEMTNDVDRGSGLACVERGMDTPGNDGFIGVQMRFGDVWHVHMTPDPREDVGGKDPAFYVLDALCDVRDCSFGVDRCGEREDEHFTFVARNDGVHFLGIDDRTEGGGVYAFTATRVECGNGKSQHGKACDASDPMDPNRDRCDNACRVVLQLRGNNEATDVGTHDDFTVANVIPLGPDGARLVTVLGTIEGCYPGYFTFTAQTGQRLNVTMLDEFGLTCADTPGRSLLLELRDARDELLQAGVPTDDNRCPSLTRDDLSEGRYYIKVADGMASNTSQLLGYRLRIELSTP